MMHPLIIVFTGELLTGHMNTDTNRKRKIPVETDVVPGTPSPVTAPKKPRRTPKTNKKTTTTPRGRGGKRNSAKMASGAYAGPSADEAPAPAPAPVPEGTSAQFAAIMTKLTAVDTSMNAALEKQGKDFQQELVKQAEAFRGEVARVQERMEVTADNLTRSVGSISDRVRKLETGGGREKALLEEISIANKKLFLRTQGTCTLEQFNAKLAEASAARAIGWKTFPVKDGWHMFSVIFGSNSDREDALFDSVEVMKNLQTNGRTLLKRETPPSYKRAVESLNMIATSQKSASARMDGNNVKYTVSSKIVYIGTKAVLKIKEKGTNDWTKVAEREADEPEGSSREGGNTSFLVDLSKTVLFHGVFEEGQLLSLIEQHMGRDGASLGIVEIIQGAKCSKVTCARKEEATFLAAQTKHQPIPGRQNSRFSCTFLP